MTSSKRLDDFLREMRLHPQCVDVLQTAEAFADAMGRGLAGEKSSLMMLKTYLSAPEKGAQGRAAAVDIGGTNLRAVLTDVRDGKVQIVRQAAAPVPGRGASMTKDAFFDAVAALLRPVTEGCDAMGVAFSHSAEILPSRDGRILSLSKEMDVTGIEGAEVCREIQNALRRLGAAAPERCALLNDTTAVALAASSEAAGEDVMSLVLGTGMNICYFDGGAGMFINTEAAGFNAFPRGEADALLDHKTAAPGEHLLEKAASGGYFGGLTLTALRIAAREGLVSPRCAEEIAAVDTLTTEQVSAFLSGAGEGEVLRRLCQEAQDAETVTALIDALLERAARLVAAAVTGVLLHTGAGKSADRPAVLSLEGSMILRMHSLRERLEALLKSEAAGKPGRYCAVTVVPDAVIRGAALAALTEQRALY